MARPSGSNGSNFLASDGGQENLVRHPAIDVIGKGCTFFRQPRANGNPVSNGPRPRVRLTVNNTNHKALENGEAVEDLIGI